MVLFCNITVAVVRARMGGSGSVASSLRSCVQKPCAFHCPFSRVDGWMHKIQTKSKIDSSLSLSALSAVRVCRACQDDMHEASW
jgi:hypothetical protein